MGKPFILQTDWALKWLQKSKKRITCLLKCSLMLQPCTFTIQHCQGLQNRNPDAPSLPSNHSIIKKYQPILQASERIMEAFRLPPLIAFDHPRNLRDLLVRAALTSTAREPPGNYPCGAPRCKTCPILLTWDEFSSHTTGNSFKVKIWPSGKSSNVINLITCRRCGQQYVGETGQPFHLRVNGHRFDIAHTKDWQISCVSALQQRFTHSSRHVGHGNRTCSKPKPLSAQDKAERVDYDPGNIVPSGNESQKRYPVKPATAFLQYPWYFMYAPSPSWLHPSHSDNTN